MMPRVTRPTFVRFHWMKQSCGLQSSKMLQKWFKDTLLVRHVIVFLLCCYFLYDASLGLVLVSKPNVLCNYFVVLLFSWLLLLWFWRQHQLVVWTSRSVAAGQVSISSCCLFHLSDKKNTFLKRGHSVVQVTWRTQGVMFGTRSVWHPKCVTPEACDTQVTMAGAPQHRLLSVVLVAQREPLICSEGLMALCTFCTLYLLVWRAAVEKKKRASAWSVFDWL